jgi:hypothetical protein
MGYVGARYRNWSREILWAVNARRNRKCAHNMHTKGERQRWQSDRDGSIFTPTDSASGRRQVNEVRECYSDESVLRASGLQP